MRSLWSSGGWSYFWRWLSSTWGSNLWVFSSCLLPPPHHIHCLLLAPWKTIIEQLTVAFNPSARMTVTLRWIVLTSPPSTLSINPWNSKVVLLIKVHFFFCSLLVAPKTHQMPVFDSFYWLYLYNRITMLAVSIMASQVIEPDINWQGKNAEEMELAVANCLPTFKKDLWNKCKNLVSCLKFRP